jgi:DedD protein
MEKKTTQRIIGILVVIALVIILLPLLFGKNELVTQAAIVKAPPFPEQQKTEVTPSTDDTAQPVAQADANNAANATPVPQADTQSAQQTTANADPSQPEATSNADAGQPVAQGIASASSDPVDPSVVKQVNDKDAANAAQESMDITPAVAAEVNGTTPPAADHPATTDKAATPSPQAQNDSAINPADQNEQAGKMQTTENNSPARPDAQPKEQHAGKVRPEKSASVQKNAEKPAILTDSSKRSHKSLVKLKTTAWVVQMGSFKDKSNARRLADKLRAAGFKAFTHEVKSAKGNESTRVWVGPEYRQASAAKLSTQIEEQFKMRGILVTFKPLEL